MRIRFSIRDLLWLTLVVALAVGWWLDRRNVVAERDRLQTIVELIDAIKYLESTDKLLKSLDEQKPETPPR